MKTSLLTLAGLCALSSAAQAQIDLSGDLMPAPTNVSYRGVYNAATHQITPASVANRNRGLLGDPIYANTAFGGQFINLVDGRRIIDQGRIPAPASTDVVGTQNSYDLTSFELVYATNATDPSLGGTGHAIEIILTESGTACVAGSDLEAPLVTLPLLGLPGSTTPGAIAVVSIDIDISALNLCMRSEGRDGVSGNTTDRFTWSFRVLDVADATAVGPLIAGDPVAAPFGDGTVFQNPAAVGTGLGTGDLFRSEGSSDPMVTDGCRFFGGFANGNNYASFEFTLRSGLTGDCIGCGIGDDRFEPNDNPTQTRAVTLRTYPALLSNTDDDWFRVDVEPNQSVAVDILFSDAISDLDLFLLDAAGTNLATSDSPSDDESVSYRNCGTAAETIFIRIDNFGGVCNEYDLVLSELIELMDDALEDNDTCLTPVALPLGLSRDLVLFVDPCTGDEDFDYYSITLAAGETLAVDLLFDTDISDIDIFAYDIAIGCDGGTNDPETLDFGFTGSDNESIVTTNTTGAPQDVVVRVDRFGGTSGSNTYDMLVKVTSAPTFGEALCVGNENSVGNGTRLSASGSDVAADNALTLDITNAPPMQFGLFFASQDLANFVPAGSQGTLCIGSLTLARFNDSLMMTDAMGAASFTPNLTAVPFTNGGVDSPLAVMAGDELLFQFWHRDLDAMMMATSNFSDAISVDFQ